MDPERVKVIADWPRPRCIHDVQVFLGFVNFYRRFIEGYSHITRPLTDLLRKEDPSMGTPMARQSLSKGRRVRGKLPACRHLASVGSGALEPLSDMSGGAVMLETHEPAKSTLNGNRQTVQQMKKEWQWTSACEKAFK